MVDHVNKSLPDVEKVSAVEMKDTPERTAYTNARYRSMKVTMEGFKWIPEVKTIGNKSPSLHIT